MAGATYGSPMEKILQRTIIIGEIVQFRNLLSRALHDVLERRIPFLMRSMHSLVDICDEIQRISIDEMTAAAGVESKEVDLGLVNAIKAQAQVRSNCAQPCTVPYCYAIPRPTTSATPKTTTLFHASSWCSSQCHCPNWPSLGSPSSAHLQFVRLGTYPTSLLSKPNTTTALFSYTKQLHNNCVGGQCTGEPILSPSARRCEGENARVHRPRLERAPSHCRDEGRRANAAAPIRVHTPRQDSPPIALPQLWGAGELFPLHTHTLIVFELLPAGGGAGKRCEYKIVPLL